MGYEKPSAKLTFYKAFFLPQWKFLIHTILQCMSAKRTSWNEFSSSMALAVICLSTGRKFNFSKYIFDSLVRNVDSSTKFYMYPRFLQLIIRAQVGDLSSHSTKYSSPALIQKVFSNMRRVGKGFSGVDTPLFEGIIMAQQDDDISDEGAASVAVDNVPAAVDEPSIPSPPPTTPHHHHHKIYLLPHTYNLLHHHPQLLNHHHLNNNYNLHNLHLMLKYQWIFSTLSWKHGRIIASMDADVDVTLKDVVDIAKEVVVDVEIKESTDVQGRQVESQAQIYQIDLEQADKVLSLQDDELEPVELKEVVKVVTTAKIMTEVVTTGSATITAADTLITTVALTVALSAARRRKRVVIRDPEETARPSIIIHFKAKSKDKGKGILDDVIDQVQRKEKEDNAVMRLKKKWKKKTAEHLREQMKVKQKKAKKQKLDEEMILLVERRYPLTRFTLDQMLNNVRLKVEEESEVSLELLRFVRQQQQEGFRPE
nr:hypothetical protein [Tanacetum cinerariifolium]